MQKLDYIWNQILRTLYLLRTSSGNSWMTCKVLKKRMTSNLSFRNMALPITSRMDDTTGKVIIIKIISCHLLWFRHYVSDLHRFNDLIIIEPL